MDFPSPQSHNRTYDTRVFLARNHSEKRDLDPRVFRARSATHYKLGVNPRFSWPKIHSVRIEEKCDRVPQIKLIRSATHYKLGVNLGIFWPKTHLVKDMILGFSWPGIADSARDMTLGFSSPDHSSRDFCPRVFLAQFVDPWCAILRFSLPDTSPNNKMAFGFSWPSCPLDTQVFLA